MSAIDRSRFELGALADPTRFTGPIDLNAWPVDKLIPMLRMMLTIRTVEQRVAGLIEEGLARCPCHLAIGQEATAVGVSESLGRTDRVFGCHRSHGHYLALGGNVYRLFAEILGRVDGCSGGRGGSMHLVAHGIGFMGSTPIVAGTIPLAVGAALAAKKDGNGAVAVSYFGDGAGEEGVLHESLNFASQFGLPVLFVCENNLFSSHLDICLRQPGDRIARFAEVHDISCRVVDGNDVVAVAEAARELVAGARRGDGPGFLEAVTYRWCGHVGPKEDIDVGLRRKAADLAAWKKRDPIRRLAEALEQRSDLDQGAHEAMTAEVMIEIRRACDRAVQTPYPDESALLDFVYAEPENR